MGKRFTEKEFGAALCCPRVKDDFRNMSIEGIYKSCYNVIERAAELYSELYNIEKDELIGEANIAFLDAIAQVNAREYKTTSVYIQTIKRLLNSRLYDFCEAEVQRTSCLSRLQDLYKATDEDFVLYCMTGRVIEDVLSTLTERQKQVILKYYYNQMSLVSISKELGITLNDTNRALNCGLMRLRRPSRAEKLLPFLGQYD